MTDNTQELDELLGDLVGKVLDHSQKRMPGEVQMYKMYIERTKQAILNHLDKAISSSEEYYYDNHDKYDMHDESFSKTIRQLRQQLGIKEGE